MNAAIGAVAGVLIVVGVALLTGRAGDPAWIILAVGVAYFGGAVGEMVSR